MAPISTPVIGFTKVETQPKTADPYYQRELARFKAQVLQPTETAAKQEFTQSIETERQQALQTIESSVVAAQKQISTTEKLATGEIWVPAQLKRAEPDLAAITRVKPSEARMWARENLGSVEQWKQEQTLKVETWASQQQAKFETEVLQPWKQEQIASFTEQWKPPSVSERILHVGETKQKFPTFTMGVISPPKMTFETVKPLGAVAGLVAYPETLAYTAISLAGINSLTRPPPSLEEGGHEYRTGYAVSYVLSTYLLGELISKTPIGKAEAWAIQKAKSGVKALKTRLAGRKTVVTGWQRVWGSKGWEYREIMGTPTKPTPIKPTEPSFVSTGYEDFYIQLSRSGAGAKVPVQTVKPPWKLYDSGAWPKQVVLKIPPSPEAGGLVILKEPVTDLGVISTKHIATRDILRHAIVDWKPPVAMSIGITPLPVVTPPSKLELKPFSPPKIEPLPITIVSPKFKPLATPTTKAFTVPSIKPIQKTFPSLTLEPSVTTTQSTKQIEKQVAQTLQLQKPVTAQLQIQVPKMRSIQVPRYLREPYRTKRKKRKKQEEELFGLFGRQKRFWPVATPKQVLKKVLE